MESITAKELQARIKEILDYGSVIFSKHVKTQMIERNYSTADVLHILRTGEILNIQEESTEEYKCKVHGEDLDGVLGTVIAIVIKNHKLFIVTVLGGT